MVSMVINEFKVSVVIPVYNAEKYLENAVLSAVQLPEVEEVILIEDGSPDNGRIVCERLADTHDKVVLLFHPNKENRGPGASRNLGVKYAKSEYIAFLDADDFFLPDRFRYAKARFINDPQIEALYEPVGTVFESKDAQLKFCKWRKISKESSEKYLTYPKVENSGIPFFHSILEGRHGTPSTIGIIIKKGVFNESFQFDERLRLHQDTALWIKIASRGKFHAGGHRNAVAMRRVHDDNRIGNRNFKSVLLKDQYIYQWSKTADLDKKATNLILRNYISAKLQYIFKSNSIITKLSWRVVLFVTLGLKSLGFRFN